MSAPEEEKRANSVEDLDIEKHEARAGLPHFEENPELEKRITWKTDIHILPWIFALWLLAFIDRSNIGNGRTSKTSFCTHETRSLTLGPPQPNSTVSKTTSASRGTNSTSP